MLRFLVRSAMCALMPPAAGFPGVEELGVDAWVQRFSREATPTLWLGVVAGSLLFALFPLFTIGVPLPAFLLGRRSLDRYAARITRHPIYLVRQAVFIVKMAAGMCWGASDVVRRKLALAAYPVDPGKWRTS